MSNDNLERGSEVGNLSNMHSCNVGWPPFSPDSKGVAYMSGEPGCGGVYVADLDGKNVKRIDIEVSDVQRPPMIVVRDSEGDSVGIKPSDTSKDLYMDPSTGEISGRGD